VRESEPGKDVDPVSGSGVAPEVTRGFGSLRQHSPKDARDGYDDNDSDRKPDRSEHIHEGSSRRIRASGRYFGTISHGVARFLQSRRTEGFQNCRTYG